MRYVLLLPNENYSSPGKAVEAFILARFPPIGVSYPLRTSLRWYIANIGSRG